MRCERCKEEAYFLEKCNFCGRMIDRDCEKSSKRPERTVRAVICKDDWSNLKHRSAYKSM